MWPLNVAHFNIKTKTIGRIDGRNWLEKDIEIVKSGGIFDLFDNQNKTYYRINDDEYDHLCVIMTDEELNIFTSEKPTFQMKRKQIELLNKYLNYE